MPLFMKMNDKNDHCLPAPGNRVLSYNLLNSLHFGRRRLFLSCPAKETISIPVPFALPKVCGNTEAVYLS